ncbi:TadE/TadG family type IV pilus assembly protein [Sphingomicrobium nitratireducens]|uniref:TadE/TadG family type IV pilus assembly protein n=1 Tax=Sphingomicrobium nitratireducens TaxID=2964666 RepID=UPI00223E8F8B|nr:TadE/TadG family type IV pilus assembly protein [Sphingomicrobium nitratireducens]
MKKFLNLLKRDERGTSVIELAMVAPVLITLIIGVSDLSLAYSEKLNLEQSAQRAVEKVMQRSANGTTTGTLRAEAAATAGVDASEVTVDAWLECDGVRQDNYDTTCTSGTTYARYLSVDIQSEYEPMFPLKVFGANDNGNYDINGHAGIRTQ